MSLSVWFVIIIVVTICTIVFKKTISNDAANDFKLRDILSSKDDESEQQGQIKSAFLPTEPDVQQELQPKSYEEYEKQTENIYEEMVREQEKSSMDFGTTVHEQEEIQDKNSEHVDYQEKVYYEKINDDACDVDENYEEDGYEVINKKNKPTKRRSLFDYVKTFWRGITFSVGLLVCLYSVIGIAYQVQTSNDAIIYSLWLLIGVILIK